jgi:hypothetical protein
MADIVLAEFGGNTWLVAGEEQIDALLANMLPPDAAIELVSCGSKQEVIDLWLSRGGDPGLAGDPWVIHPAIVARIRRTQGGFSIFFGEWSAMLDAAAAAVIEAAAEAGRRDEQVQLVLTEHLAQETSSTLADLSRLRLQLIEQRLVEAGLGRERIGRARREAGPEESGRVDIVIAPL